MNGQGRVVIVIVRVNLGIRIAHNKPRIKHIAQLRIYTPAEVKKPAGHVWVIVVRLLLPGLPVSLQTALPALVQVGCNVNAGAVLQEGLPRLLQAPQLGHVLQHRLAHCLGREGEL